jgi:hypothetical protein
MMIASLGPTFDETFVADRDGMPLGHPGGDYTPDSSLAISSLSIFCTLLLAT